MAGATERLNYTDGDRLDLRDLVTEQTYHLEQFRRHLLSAHSWGIVTGLNLTADPEGAFVIEPGLAVDGYGRALLLDRPLTFATPAFTDRDTAELDVYLSYSLTLESSGGTGPCEGAASDRAIERPYLSLEVPDPNRRPRSLPPGVPTADLAYSAERPPVSATQPWPVYLGRARYDPADDPPLAPDPAGRRYAGVRAERIEATSGEALLDIGLGDEGAGDEDAARMAYRVGTGAAGRTVFEVTQDGKATLAGDLTVEGDITLEDGALGLKAQAGAAATQPPPASLSLADGEALDGTATTDLRLALPEPPHEGIARFTVGAWSEDAGRFQDILTVDHNGQVTLSGNLTQLPSNSMPGQPKAVPDFDETAQQFVQASMFNAISGTGSAIVNAIVGGGAVGPVAAEGLGLSGTHLGGAIAQILTTNQVEDFAKQLHDLEPDLAESLAAAVQAAKAAKAAAGGSRS